MGKIIKNGIEYAGATASDASKIAYDNTSSKLNATTTQGAIDEIDAKIDNNITNVDTLETNVEGLSTRVGENETAITQLNSDLDNKVTNSFTAGRVMVSDSNGNASVSSSVTTKELEYLDGVTSKIQTQLNEKQKSLLYNTYVSTNTADDNGAITLGIDISSLNLTSKPKSVFLQSQHSGFERYIYSYDSSTKSLAVFVISYGSAMKNQSITDRYGFVVFP